MSAYPVPYKPLVFIHLPRTAGTTFHQLVIKQFSESAMLRISSPAELEQFRHWSEADKAKYKFVFGHIGFSFDSAIEPPYPCVTFLREPVARVASIYQYIRSNPAHTHHKTVVERNLPLADFIEQRVSVMNTDNGMTRLLCGLPDDARSVPFGGCTPDMLAAAKKNLRERVTVLGLTEQFDASLVLLRRHFGWKSPLYTRKNITGGGSRTQELEPREVDLIQAANELDLKLYAYARVLFRNQLMRALPWIPIQVRYFRNKNRVFAQDPAEFKRMRQFESKRIARWLDLK